VPVTGLIGGVVRVVAPRSCHVGELLEGLLSCGEVIGINNIDYLDLDYY
jgi:hypothetical protein